MSNGSLCFTKQDNQRNELDWNWDLDLLIAWVTTMRMLLETAIMNLAVINSESTCDQKHANVSAISPRHFLTQLIEHFKNEECFTITDRFIETRRRQLILSKLIFHRLKKNPVKIQKMVKIANYFNPFKFQPHKMVKHTKLLVRLALKWLKLLKVYY